MIGAGTGAGVGLGVGVGLAYPLDQAALLVEGHHRIGADPQLPQAAGGVLGKQLVDQAIEFHHAVVASQIVAWFAKEDVVPAIASTNGHFLGPHQRLKQLNLVAK